MRFSPSAGGNCTLGAAQMFIEQSRLGALRDPVGEGGEGEVHRLTTEAVKRVGHRGALVAKLYPQPLRGARANALTSNVIWLAGLHPASRGALLRSAAWPIGLIGSPSAIDGVIMPDLTPAFEVDISLEGGRTRSKLSDVSYLLESDSVLARRLGVTLGDAGRLACAQSIARAIEYLHTRGIVLVDVSGRNTLVVPKPPFRTAFIDADGMRRDGVGKSTGHEHTPGFELPAGELANSPESDVFKFALLVLRLLLSSRRAGRSSVQHAPQALQALFHASLGEKSNRPTISEWVKGFDSAREAHSLSGLRAARAAALKRRGALPQPRLARPVSGGASFRSQVDPPRPPSGGSGSRGAIGSFASKRIFGVTLLICIPFILLLLAGESDSGRSTGFADVPLGSSGASGATGATGMEPQHGASGPAGTTGLGEISFGSESLRRLRAMIPQEVEPCRPVVGSRSALASVRCLDPGSGARVAEYVCYPSPSAVRLAFRRAVSRARVSPDIRIRSLGEWSRDGSDVEAGQLLKATNQPLDRSMIVWSAIDQHVLGIGRGDRSLSLYRWWRSAGPTKTEKGCG